MRRRFKNLKYNVRLPTTDIGPISKAIGYFRLHYHYGNDFNVDLHDGDYGYTTFAFRTKDLATEFKLRFL